jgi:molybdenum cofactor biosynthesis protein A
LIEGNFVPLFSCFANILDIIQNANVLPSQLFDNHGRRINYLRLAVTDRCNLRCFYCMPAEGVKYMPEKQLLTWEEMIRLVGILHELGIRKVRITGGEPFVRNGLMEFLEEIARLKNLEICLTSNGVLLEKHIPQLLQLGIHSVNLSMESLDRHRFKEITRRDDFDVVFRSLEAMIEAKMKVKINAVVMEGKNDQDIHTLSAFTEKNPVSVRFIEEMPFNGLGQSAPQLTWDFIKIIEHIKEKYPQLAVLNAKYGDTAMNYQIPGFAGNIGVIAAFSRTFCGTCNRLRITAKGEVKTCLYDDGVYDLKNLLRQNATDDEIKKTIIALHANRPLDGFEAEKNRKNVIQESMTTIGG